MNFDANLTYFVLSMVVKGAILLVLIWASYSIWLRKVVRSLDDQKPFPFGTSVFFVILFVLWAWLANLEIAFRQPATQEDELFRRRGQEVHQSPGFHPSQRETIDEKAKRLIEQSKDQNRKQVDAFDKNVPNAQDR
jgi:hypothetical protein